MESQVRIGGEQALSQLWEKARLFVTDEFLQPPVILRVEDSIIGTLGNFSASTGKAKSKKTFNVCAIVAAALRNSLILNYSASLPQDKRRILYADTEQSKFHCQRVLRRILQLLGLLTGSQSDKSEFLPLRRPDELFPCAEYSGQYAYPLYCVCEELSLDLWLENPTQIKYRSGFQRGKNDRLDAKKIAAYACKFVEKAWLLRLPEEALETLKHLVNERDMYVIERAKLAGQLSRQERFMDKTLFQKKKEPLESILHELEQSMADIDKEIKE